LLNQPQVRANVGGGVKKDAVRPLLSSSSRGPRRRARSIRASRPT